MIDTKLIAKLRNMTGAGIADCKSVLEEANNDIDQAVEILRKKGAVKAAKKSDRETREGIIAIAGQDDRIAVVGLACETDFAARNENFIKASDDFAKKLLDAGSEEDFKTWVQEQIKGELIVKIGENIQLVEAEVVEGEVIGVYLHSNKKVASTVVMSGGSQELAADLAMQVAAMSPKYVKPEDVPEQEINKEKEIYQEQLKAESKPQDIWDKIIPGKISKYYKEVCLIKQAFVKDDKKTVEELLKETGQDIEVIKFSRYSI